MQDDLMRKSGGGGLKGAESGRGCRRRGELMKKGGGAKARAPAINFRNNKWQIAFCFGAQLFSAPRAAATHLQSHQRFTN